MPDYTGRQFRNYRLVRQLGQGGFATVYLGEHVKLNNRVAIKVLQNLRRPLTEEDSNTFLEEARTLANLRHPHIIHVSDYDVVEIGQENIPFLVMDYAERGTLRDAHPYGTRVPLKTVVEYVKQIAGALQYAHDRVPKLVHRDVKPENMLVDGEGTILLSDFGLAVLSRTSHTQAGQQGEARENAAWEGTLAYMAPEQFAGDPSRRSDQYSLSIVVYEWLCGRPPFEGDAVALAYQHRFVQPVTPLAYNRNIPPAVAEVVLKALAKEREDRFERVIDFAEALEAAYIEEQRRLAEERRQKEEERLAEERRLREEQLRFERRRLLARGGIVIASAITVGAVGFGVGILLKQNPPPKVTPTPTATQEAKHQQGELVRTYTGHSMPVNAVAWSPDGKMVASGGDDDTLQVWSATQSQVAGLSTQYGASVNAVAWSLNGRLIGVGVADGSIQVTNTGFQGPILSANYGPVQGITFSPDGVHVVAVYGDKTGKGGGEYVIWDTHTGKGVSTPGENPISSVSWSSKIPGTAGIVLGDLAGDVIIPQKAFTNASAAIAALAWSPDGTLIAAAAANGVHVWRLTSSGFSVVATYPHGAQALAWSPDSAYIASGGTDNKVMIWDVQSGQAIYTYSGHKRQINGLSWSSGLLKSSLIASASSDTTVQVWYPFAS
jgi:serine/threonine protein kinase/WD40 repeat protein